MFLRHFLHSSLVNLPLLASLEKKFTHRVLDCFLGAGDGDDLEEEFLVDGATCYELKPLKSDNRTTLVLSNTRELNRDPFTK